MLKVVAGWTAGAVAFVGVCFGGYEGYWALAKHNADNSSHVVRQSYGNQQTLRDQVTKNFGDLTEISTQIVQSPEIAGQLRAQRLAMLNILCQNASEVTGDPLPDNQASFVAQNCLYGQANPSSIYAQAGN